MKCCDLWGEVCRLSYQIIRLDSWLLAVGLCLLGRVHRCSVGARLWWWQHPTSQHDMKSDHPVQPHTPSPRLRGPPTTPRLGFQRSDSARISIGRGRTRNSLKTPSPRPGGPVSPSLSRGSQPTSPSPGPRPASPASLRPRPSRGRGRPVSLPNKVRLSPSLSGKY